jgi:hypothetical protein
MQRLKIEDKEVKSAFIAYEHAKERGDASVGAHMCTREDILEVIFENEPVNIETFRKNYLPLVSLQPKIKTKVDKGELGARYRERRG